MSEYIEKYYTEEELPKSKFYEYKKDKLLKEKGLQVNGKKEGVWIEGYFNIFNNYYYIEINYINNIKNGKFIVYYNNNNICIECNYINDKKEGYYKRYHENNNIHIECYYYNDKKEGECIYYDEDGNINEKLYYKNEIEIDI
jgi:antitoxin component YwqK of YwqJK toxin-antitoxin module